jgi:hypothetical protein
MPRNDAQVYAHGYTCSHACAHGCNDCSQAYALFQHMNLRHLPVIDHSNRSACYVRMYTLLQQARLTLVPLPLPPTSPPTPTLSKTNTRLGLVPTRSGKSP